MKEAYDESNAARQQAMESVNAEFDHIEELKDELLTLVDANGEVKTGEEDRAAFIVNELSSALGMEKEQIWEIIQGNGELSDSIDQVIEKKRAEAIVEANQSMYVEAIQNLSLIHI